MINAKNRAYRENNPWQQILSLARSRAKKNNMEFDIQKNMEFSISRRNIIVPNVCPILGIDIDHGDGVFTDNSPSIDRIDNSVGYVPSNIRVISRRANTLKNNASLEEYSKIYEFYTAIASKREEAVYLLQQTLDQD
jgi:hypothetical protein